MADDVKQTGWAWLDTLGANVSNLANAYLTTEVAARIQGSSAPAVAKVPNSSPGVANTTASGISDPNRLQRYALWGAVGVGVILVAVIALKALKR